MRPSLRFLTVAVVGWAGFRAATLGALPGAEIFRIDRSEAKPPPPIIVTEFPPILPVEALEPSASFQSAAPASIQYAQGFVGVPVAIGRGVIPIYPLPAAAPPPPAIAPARLNNVIPSVPDFYSRIPPIEEWALSPIAAVSRPVARSTVPAAGQSIPVAPRQIVFDRVQLTAWALLRSRRGVIGPTSLASGGTLGASQAGTRLNYNITPQVAATLRSSSDVGRRGGELAAGIRVQPLVSVWLTAERRQRLGRYGGGRNAFAMLAEGGVYDRPLPLQFSLDAYLQGGIVGFHSRDGFIDGGLTVTRPLFRQFHAGVGVWGGAQPGLYRVDAGPRVTVHVRNNVRVHLDWRQRLTGNAQPGSGPALTLAADF